MTDPMREDTVPALAVTINGRLLYDPKSGRLGAGLGADLLEVTIEDTLDGASKFTLRADTWDLDKQKVSWADQLGVGAEVEIALGYADSTMETMIVGDIINLDVNFGGGKSPVLTAAGYGILHRLGRSGRTRSHNDQKHSDIARAVIEENKLSADVSDTTDTHPSTFQDNRTDLELLQELAERNLFVVLARGKTVVFGPAPDKIIQLSLSPDRQAGRKEMLEFDGRFSAEKLAKQIKVLGRDGSGQELAACVPVPPFPGVARVDDFKQIAADERTVDGVVKTAPDAQKKGEAYRQELLENMITASGKCPGNPEIRAGIIIQITGAGERFSQKYRVTSATHSYSPAAGYVTSFALKWSLK